MLSMLAGQSTVQTRTWRSLYAYVVYACRAVYGPDTDVAFSVCICCLCLQGGLQSRHGRGVLCMYMLSMLAGQSTVQTRTWRSLYVYVVYACRAVYSPDTDVAFSVCTCCLCLQGSLQSRHGRDVLAAVSGADTDAGTYQRHLPLQPLRHGEHRAPAALEPR
eukprot:TRINITY_DN122325_c0_g1_i7.p2 TRINITY_DN122325_c0_g1~~TRINITY_DN122325_c0_g1_i7.p2  ORF type:complete len:162 (+),score=6.76 TRINITY_DN122325_c0_g1_i7:1-486(+)